MSYASASTAPRPATPTALLAALALAACSDGAPPGSAWAASPTPSCAGACADLGTLRSDHPASTYTASAETSYAANACPSCP